MPRKPMSGAPLGALLQDLSVAALLRVIPVSLVGEALESTQRQSKRLRLLPATAVVYLVVMLGLHAEASVQENLRILLAGLRQRFGLKRVQVPGGTAISFSRQRLGVAPLRWLFERIARPVGQPDQPGYWWHGWRPMALDGTVAEVQCTAANVARFGQHRNQHGASGYPQVRIVSLLECASLVPVGFNYGGSRENEGKMADPLLDRAQKDMLVMADRGFYSYARWRDWSSRCGALVWRVRNDLALKVEEHLYDGSFLAWIRPSADLCRQGLAKPDEKMMVRAVRYQAVLADGKRGETVLLITTILDPAVADALELARLYPQRWTVETGFDELKTHLRGPQRILRSQLPELVEQELYGFFIAYYAVRATMTEAASRDGCMPNQLSFTHAVRVIRRHTAFFPSAKQMATNL
jgi:hypothetical protein